MKYTYLIILFILVSCGKTAETDQVIEQEKQGLDFSPATSRMELKGPAIQFSTSWIAYQKFITDLENFDHTTTAAEGLNLSIDDMKVSLPESITKQSVKSRLKVLDVRVKSYHALLTHNSYSSKEQQKRFNELILALDQFKIQMMEVFELQKAEENILKNLEEMHLEVKEKDTINSL